MNFGYSPRPIPRPYLHADPGTYRYASGIFFGSFNAPDVADPLVGHRGVGLNSVSGEARVFDASLVASWEKRRGRSLGSGGFEWHGWSRSGSRSRAIFRSLLASRERFGFIPRAARKKT